MGKTIRLLCLLLIGALLLTGCNAGVIGDAIDASKTTVSEKTFTNDGVTLTLTTKFIDFTDTDTNSKNYAFFYASDTYAVFAIKELKADLTSFGELDAQKYGDLLAVGYELGTTTQEKDGKYTLTYEVDEEDGSKLTFLCLILESQDAFWFIQASCPSEQFDTDKDQIWSWLTSATVTEG